MYRSVFPVSLSLLDNPTSRPASSARNLEKVRNSQLKSAAIITEFPSLLNFFCGTDILRNTSVGCPWEYWTIMRPEWKNCVRERRYYFIIINVIKLCTEQRLLAELTQLRKYVLFVCLFSSNFTLFQSHFKGKPLSNKTKMFCLSRYMDLAVQILHS